MNLYVILVYLLAATFHVMEVHSLIKEDADAPRACVMERVQKKLGYVCSNLNLKEIPQTLKTSTELLDVSFNRIRDLSPKSFENYLSIKYLYIFENMLQTIEPHTFSQLQDLEALDLSTNGLTTIPKELFDLPLLRNLYINDNALTHLASDLKLVNKPIRAPLQILSLSKCRLDSIPDFGILPDLYSLNISSNDLSQIEPHSLSAFCTMRKIGINETRIPMCKCLQMSQYLRERRIYMQDGINCDTMETRSPELTYCAEPANQTNYDTPDYHLCISLVNTKKLQEKSKYTWMSIAGALIGFFVVFMSVLYCFHRRSIRKTKEMQEITKLKKIHSGEFGNNEVLLKEEKL